MNWLIMHICECAKLYGPSSKAIPYRLVLDEYVKACGLAILKAMDFSGCNSGLCLIFSISWIIPVKGVFLQKTVLTLMHCGPLS